jgi:hypothetical protein
MNPKEARSKSKKSISRHFLLPSSSDPQTAPPFIAAGWPRLHDEEFFLPILLAKSLFRSLGTRENALIPRILLLTYKLARLQTLGGNQTTGLVYERISCFSSIRFH